MSYFIDVKYLNTVAHKLPLFSKKKSDLWNCRCIICGDSKTNKRKARGYFYRQKNDLYYKCHNCLASQHFGTFLKNLDNHAYQQYVFERYAKGENGPKAHTNAEEFVYEYKKVEFKNKEPLDLVAKKLSDLPDDNEAVQYCLTRKIPRDKFSQLYYIPSVQYIKTIAPQYDAIKTEEPRLLLPFYNEHNELTGMTMRALRSESLRYMMVKLKDDEALIFGMNSIDKTRPITIVEGPIDSLFLDNSLAVAGTGFGKIESLNLPKEHVTIVFDNQSRNTEVCKLVEKYIKLDYNVVIWPCNIQEKDINDMVKNNINVKQLIQNHTYQGLMAQLKFTEWRNC
jgi:hypothetical protein